MGGQKRLKKRGLVAGRRSETILRNAALSQAVVTSDHEKVVKLLYENCFNWEQVFSLLDNSPSTRFHRFFKDIQQKLGSFQIISVNFQPIVYTLYLQILKSVRGQERKALQEKVFQQNIAFQHRGQT